MIKFIATILLLTPNIEDWSSFQDTTFTQYHLSGGDYTHLGMLNIENRKGILICGDSSVLKGVELKWCRSVVVSKVVTYEFPIILRQSKSCTIKDSWFYQDRRIGVRILNGSDSVSILDNHFEVLTQPVRDMPAIVFQNISKGGLVAGNTIINFVDGVATFDQRNTENDLPGLTIENNDIYIDDRIRFFEDGQQFAHAENAIDLKVGSSDKANPVVVKNNKLHGHRWTKGSGSGSGGDEVIIHRWAKNIHIIDNEIYDGVGGVRVMKFYVDGQAIYPNDRGVIISGNNFHNIYKRSERVSGAVYDIGSKTEITGNTERYFTIRQIER